MANLFECLGLVLKGLQNSIAATPNKNVPERQSINSCKATMPTNTYAASQETFASNALCFSTGAEIIAAEVIVKYYLNAYPTFG